MRVGIKSGVFGLFHAGHIFCFQECRKKCDYLIVLTNNDEYVLRKKGNVPINLNDRLYILKHIKGIDEADWFSGDTEDSWIENFKKNRLCQEFGANAELIVFHSDELEGNLSVPGERFADKIFFIPKKSRKESVTKIYNEIRGNNVS